ncbi:MAG TPA: hypothetical protein VKY39_02485 [Aggregatilineales bacterium]|jgi:hypothetical protein|nr:hypothetical protein [Aggregatilineales bacterium]
MATKPTTKRKTTSSGRSASSKSKPKRTRSTKPASEPLPARMMQFVVLIAGVLLFLGALFGWRWALGLIGVVVFASAFPPLRATVDRWFVGKASGESANQAALLRMIAGVVVFIIALANLV